MRSLHVLALTGISLGVGLWGGRALSAAPAAAAPLATGSMESVLWTALESQSMAVFTLGPVLGTTEGEVRRWTLVVHLPGTPEMLSIVPGLVSTDDVLPVAAAGEHFSIELMPDAGMTWGTVADETDLASRVRGLY